MIRSRREMILLAVLGGLLAGSAVWAHGRCVRAKAAAQRSADDLAACESMTRRLEQLRHRPNLAGAQELQLAVVARRVEAAAKAAGLPPHSIACIWPQSPRRVGETVYKEKPTRIDLNDATLRQAAVFLYRLAESTPGLWTKSLRLTAPRGRESSEVWTVEAVVSYLMYAPPHATGAGSKYEGD